MKCDWIFCGVGWVVVLCVVLLIGCISYVII